MRTFAATLGADIRLPFTHAKFEPRIPLALPSCLKAHRSGVVATSAFVAMSGHNDATTSLTAFCGRLRQGLYLDPQIVPLLELHNRPQNSYLYDFFKHGQSSALIKFNKLTADTAYENCKSFGRVLQALSTALEVRSENAEELMMPIPNANPSTLRVLKEASAVFHSRFVEWNFWLSVNPSREH